MKRKNNGMFLLNTDIEELNKRYEQLYKNVKDSPYLTKEQITRECEVLLAKYDFEIEELNSLREVEYKVRQAKIEARNAEEIPWRRCVLWRLLLQPLTNRAQDNIEEDAAQNAEKLFAPMEQKLARRAAELYGEELKELSPRKRKKILKKYIPNKYLRSLTLDAFEELNSPTAAHEEHDAAQATAAEQLEAIIQEADTAAPEDAFAQPEPPATVQTSEQPKPKRKRKKREQLTPEDNAALKEKLADMLNASHDVTLELASMENRADTVPGQLPGQKLATIKSTAPQQLAGQMRLDEISEDDNS